MKILLTAINAKYIHSNPAIYSLRAYAAKYQDQIELMEYTINHQPDTILADIYRRNPDIVAFSCYIWNLSYVLQLIQDLHQVLPGTHIWLGGPEVSYDSIDFLEKNSQVTGIMRGEGEQSFLQLAQYYLTGQETLAKIPGITWRDAEGCIHETPADKPMLMDNIPFIYKALDEFENRIIYYESSRGCPFSCSYCLSSIDKRVRFRSLELVKQELQFFLDAKVPQVKFVDRTFNARHEHAIGIWKYINEHDNGYTNFHFEIAADILNPEEIELLRTMRPGLVQLEIGIQSVNPDTIIEIDRIMDVTQVEKNVALIHQGKNIHQHLDLIAGLPFEDYRSFILSFNRVYQMRPHQLQLGFLKVLKGSKMHQKAQDYGIAYHHQPPYEVLYSNWLSYREILRLKAVEEMVEIYYNSQQFNTTMKALEKIFATPFILYQELAKYYEDEGLAAQNHSRMKRLEILHQFAKKWDPDHLKSYQELILMDLYLRENSKTRPSWATDLSTYKEQIARFYKEESKALLPDYEGYSYRQIRTMTHLEIFMLEDGSTVLVLFDYKRRDPLTNNAWTYRRIL